MHSARRVQCARAHWPFWPTPRLPPRRAICATQYVGKTPTKLVMAALEADARSAATLTRSGRARRRGASRRAQCCGQVPPRYPPCGRNVVRTHACVMPNARPRAPPGVRSQAHLARHLAPDLTYATAPNIIASSSQQYATATPAVSPRNSTPTHPVTIHLGMAATQTGRLPVVHALLSTPIATHRGAAAHAFPHPTIQVIRTHAVRFPVAPHRRVIHCRHHSSPPFERLQNNALVRRPCMIATPKPAAQPAARQPSRLRIPLSCSSSARFPRRPQPRVVRTLAAVPPRKSALAWSTESPSRQQLFPQHTPPFPLAANSHDVRHSMPQPPNARIPREPLPPLPYCTARPFPLADSHTVRSRRRPIAPVRICRAVSVAPSCALPRFTTMSRDPSHQPLVFPDIDQALPRTAAIPALRRTARIFLALVCTPSSFRYLPTGCYESSPTACPSTYSSRYSFG